MENEHSAALSAERFAKAAAELACDVDAQGRVLAVVVQACMGASAYWGRLALTLKPRVRQ